MWVSKEAMQANKQSQSLLSCSLGESGTRATLVDSPGSSSAKLVTGGGLDVETATVSATGASGLPASICF